MSSETLVEKQSEESRPQSERTRGGRVYRPNVDIVEKQDELLVLADMPGVKGSEIDIRFEDGELTLHGREAARRRDSLSVARVRHRRFLSPVSGERTDRSVENQRRVQRRRAGPAPAEGRGSQAA